jgi:hypothetical protein
MDHQDHKYRQVIDLTYTVVEVTMYSIYRGRDFFKKFKYPCALDGSYISEGNAQVGNVVRKGEGREHIYIGGEIFSKKIKKD